MEHSFDVDVAIKYGVNAAILLHNIYWWIQKNKANNRHFHDGNYWTYNSREAYTKLFPYLSERQIKTALDKLIADGVIVTGDYNADRCKRPTWYAITKSGYSMLQKCGVECTKMSDGGSENVISTYTDILNTDINTDNISISDKSKKPKKNIYTDGFDEFYSIYPRPVVKSTALAAWSKLKPDEDLKRTIISDVKRRIDGEWKNRDEKYIPYPSTYLNQRRWEDGDGNSQKSQPQYQPKDAFGINKNDEPRRIGNGTIV